MVTADCDVVIPEVDPRQWGISECRVLSLSKIPTGEHINVLAPGTEGKVIVAIATEDRPQSLALVDDGSEARAEVNAELGAVRRELAENEVVVKAERLSTTLAELRQSVHRAEAAAKLALADARELLEQGLDPGPAEERHRTAAIEVHILRNRAGVLESLYREARAAATSLIDAAVEQRRAELCREALAAKAAMEQAVIDSLLSLLPPLLHEHQRCLALQPPRRPEPVVQVDVPTEELAAVL